MSSAYVFSKDAENDLRDIILYTKKHWGTEQARVYAQRIDQAADNLAAGQGAYKDWTAVLEGLRVKSVGSHFLFGVQRQDAPFLVLAIFHERMDLMQRLMSRLK